MNEHPLILSLFPGIGLWDMALEAEWPEACLVRGPDLLWGGDVRRFHAPAGKFDGVIGGPPCQMFSQMRFLVPNAGAKHGNMIPEFERVVEESRARWFVMENVPDAPVPQVKGYWPARLTILNNRWLGEVQERTRRFSFGVRCDLEPQQLDLSGDMVAFENPEYRQAVTSSARAVPVKFGPNGKVKRTYTEDGKRHGPDRGPRAALAEMCELQGLPATFLAEAPLTMAGKRQVIGNGIPLPMGRAIIRAVRRALESQ